MTKKELLARIEALEGRVMRLELAYPQGWPRPIVPWQQHDGNDCGCPAAGVICNNVACPRRAVVTYAATSEGEGGTR